MASGVYMIKNTVTNKVYIGSASNFERRFYLHKLNLNRNKHHSRHLQSAWNKYGQYNFEFIILEKTTCEKKILLETEQIYIDKYQSANENFGYNINPKSHSSLGVKRSEEYRKKSSEFRKGKNIGPENPMFRKSVYDIWLKKYGKTEADKRQKEANDKNRKSNSGKRKGISNPAIVELNKKRVKPVLQYDLNNNFIREWNSVTEASVALKIEPKTIRNSCLGKQSKNLIFKWKYKNSKDIISNKTKK